MSTPSVLIPLANGFEEIEGICVIDILRRAEMKVVTAALVPGIIEASRKTKHEADVLLDDVIDDTFDLVVLPGGQPGTNHLKAHIKLRECIVRHHKAGKLVAAICAAPIVLHAAGILDGKKVTSHPSVKTEFKGSEYLEERVVVEGNIITSRGAGTAIEFALKLVELVKGPGSAKNIDQAILASHSA